MRVINADAIGMTDIEIIMCDGDYKEALKMLLKKIENAPTIETEMRWIPVSERLPETDGTYLVTKLGCLGESIEIASFANDLYEVDEWDFHDMKGKAGWLDYYSEYGYCEMKDVIAWMPLPEPAKLERGGK